MLTLEGIRTEFLRWPLLVRIGLVVLLLGGLADVVAHLEAAGHADHLHEHTASELSAHVVVFVGMVLILLGVIADGVLQTHSGHRPEDSTKGGI